MNIFKNREAAKAFVALSQGLKNAKDKKKFTGIVKALFVMKSTAEEGVYKDFKVTKEDLKNLIVTV